MHIQAKKVGEEGGFPLLQCVLHNISALKKTQQEMEHLINSIPGGIAVYNVTDAITPVFCSEGVAALSGYTKEEYQALRGNDAFQAVYEEDRERVRALLLENREMLGIGQLFTREETRKLRLDGDFTFLAETDGRTAFSPRWDTEVVTAIDPTDWRTSVAGHGHLPWKGAKPMFIVKNPYARSVCTLESGRLVDEAPTMARLLGFDLPGCDGRPILELTGGSYGDLV